jgi:hypothetical protein
MAPKGGIQGQLFASQIIDWADERGMTDSELARKFGVPSSTVLRWRRGGPMAIRAHQEIADTLLRGHDPKSAPTAQQAGLGDNTNADPYDELPEGTRAEFLANRASMLLSAGRTRDAAFLYARASHESFHSYRADKAWEYAGLAIRAARISGYTDPLQSILPAIAGRIPTLRLRKASLDSLLNLSRFAVEMVCYLHNQGETQLFWKWVNLNKQYFSWLAKQVGTSNPHQHQIALLNSRNIREFACPIIRKRYENHEGKLYDEGFDLLRESFEASPRIDADYRGQHVMNICFKQILDATDRYCRTNAPTDRTRALDHLRTYEQYFNTTLHPWRIDEIQKPLLPWTAMHLLALHAILHPKTSIHFTSAAVAIGKNAGIRFLSSHLFAFEKFLPISAPAPNNPFRSQIDHRSTVSRELLRLTEEYTKLINQTN